MGLKTEKLDKLMGLFYEYPQESFTVREIAKRTKIAKSTVASHLQQLRREGQIDKENRANSSLLFKIKKINYFVERISRSGLLEELIAKLAPSCIILFGSIRKGDSMYESDIDIFIETPLKKEVSLQKYEKTLKHPIQLFRENDINDLSPQLFNNVINGIKLWGSFKVK